MTTCYENSFFGYRLASQLWPSSREALYRVLIVMVSGGGQDLIEVLQFRSLWTWACGLKCLYNSEVSLIWLMIRDVFWVGKKSFAADLGHFARMCPLHWKGVVYWAYILSLPGHMSIMWTYWRLHDLLAARTILCLISRFRLEQCELVVGQETLYFCACEPWCICWYR